MVKRRYYRVKKGQSILEYTFVIAVSIGVFLGIGAYVIRAMQGQSQATGDQMADQYAHGLNNGREHFSSRTSTFELSTPGWSHPVSITFVGGSYSSQSERNLRPLDETWYPGSNDD